MGDTGTAGFFHHRENNLEKQMEALVTENTEVALLKGELKGNKIPGLHVSKQSGVCPRPTCQLAAYNQHKSMTRGEIVYHRVQLLLSQTGCEIPFINFMTFICKLPIFPPAAFLPSSQLIPLESVFVFTPLKAKVLSFHRIIYPQILVCPSYVLA